MHVVGRRRRRMWGAVDLEVMLLGLLVMVQVQLSVQLRCSHPMHGVVDRINENAGPYIGLVMTFPTEEIVLVARAESTRGLLSGSLSLSLSLSLSRCHDS